MPWMRGVRPIALTVSLCSSGLVVRKGVWDFIVKERTGSISVGELEGEK